jgi:hypothetical protein
MAQRDDQFAVRCSAKNACAVLSNEECDATLSLADHPSWSRAREIASFKTSSACCRSM